jgi:phosphorylase/glycogen(starch) synthase
VSRPARIPVKGPSGHLFEVSWEVTNMVGGIHTVLASKASFMNGPDSVYGDLYTVIGPDLHGEAQANPAFLPEEFSPEWTRALAARGLRVRQGRWDVPGRPRCLLVDFSETYTRKDAVLSWLWEKYQVDSRMGGWDYIEPVLFSYTAGQVIACLVADCIAGENIPVMSQWHEWMVAAGMLVLKAEAPEVASVFTTHATILGRSYVGTGRPLPERMTVEEAASVAQELGIPSKHSMESAAAKAADCFTTVSGVTAREAGMFLGRTPDLLLPNALGEGFPHPMFREEDSVSASRVSLFNLAELVTGQALDRDRTLLWATSGRYEYVNKGVNMVVDALSDLREPLRARGRQVVCFMLLPAGVTGPDEALLRARREETRVSPPRISTHALQDPDHDPLLTHLRKNALANEAEDPVKVVFVPIYLDGRDPFVVRTYFEFLPAFDLTLFPSHYEPWGYTPLEAIASGVPTITSDLAGFGQWILSGPFRDSPAVQVLARAGQSYEASRRALGEQLLRMADLDPKGRQGLRVEARRVASYATWAHFGLHYLEAHAFAYRARLKRHHGLSRRRPREEQEGRPYRLGSRSERGNAAPNLQPFVVRTRLPEALQGLRGLAHNLWWSWTPHAERLFSELDPELWEACGRNPVRLLDALPQEALDDRARNAAYRRRLAGILSELEGYLKERRAVTAHPEVAYLCMEYGLHQCLPLYSGGLGVLAGDHLKAASDAKVPLVAVGLAYRSGYFRQLIDGQGNQVEEPVPNDFAAMPMEPVEREGKPLTVFVNLPGGGVALRVWRIRVGAVRLHLLDADHAENRPEFRALTRNLYGGDLEMRLRQEILLGIGSLKVLDALNFAPRAIHLNEGHAAFAVLWRAAVLVASQGLSFPEAMEFVRQTTLFTTHTPVPAGHDTFPEDLMRPHFSRFETLLGKSWESIMGLGRQDPKDMNQPFSMTVLALRGARRVNAVSRLHRRVSQEMFHSLLPGHLRSEVPVGHVTNGVHAPTWLAPEMQALLQAPRRSGIGVRPGNPALVRGLPDKDLWAVRQALKRSLLAYVQRRLEQTWRRRNESPAVLARIARGLQGDPLVVGFARRFVPYKRATLLFRDPGRLAALAGQADRPLLFLLAGKAHPKDKMGKDLLREIHALSLRKEFLGRVVLLEDYDLVLARHLVQGCDVWLNTPVRPLEASGTSGMKSALNGGINLSVLDGWWAEAYNGRNGWAIGQEHTYENQEMQDNLDSDHLYTLLEHEVIPAYFDQGRRQSPAAWMPRLKESMVTALGHFTAGRMVEEYRDLFYRPLARSHQEHVKGDFLKVRDICAARKRLREAWEGVRVEKVDADAFASGPLFPGCPVDVAVRVRHAGIEPGDLGVELVIDEPGGDGEPLKVFPLRHISSEGTVGLWKGNYRPERTGSKGYGIRVVPRGSAEGPDLSLALVRWA